MWTQRYIIYIGILFTLGHYLLLWTSSAERDWAASEDTRLVQQYEDRSQGISSERSVD